MLTVNEAEKIILDLVKPITEIEWVTLSESTNRILGHPIT